MKEKKEGAGRIRYFNNGPVYRPDMVAYGNLPDGGLSIYCYSEMPNPPEEAVILSDDNGNILGEEDVHAEYRFSRFMQCGVRLSPASTSDMLLTLLTTANGTLRTLRNDIAGMDPDRRDDLRLAIAASMRYLFADMDKPRTGRTPKKTAETVPAEKKHEKPARRSQPKTLKGEDLNRYLDMLNRQKNEEGGEEA